MAYSSPNIFALNKHLLNTDCMQICRALLNTKGEQMSEWCGGRWRPGGGYYQERLEEVSLEGEAVLRRWRRGSGLSTRQGDVTLQ